MREGGYTTAGSGKSQARHLFGVIVYGVTAAFLVAAWKGKDPNPSWAAIISALTVPLGGAWVFGKLRKSRPSPRATGAAGPDPGPASLGGEPVGAAAPSAPGALGVPTPEPSPDGGTSTSFSGGTP